MYGSCSKPTPYHDVCDRNAFPLYTIRPNQSLCLDLGRCTTCPRPTPRVDAVLPSVSIASELGALVALPIRTARHCIAHAYLGPHQVSQPSGRAKRPAGIAVVYVERSKMNCSSPLCVSSSQRRPSPTCTLKESVLLYPC